MLSCQAEEKKKPQQPQKTTIQAAEGVADLLDGFGLEQVFEVPKDWGSWVALTTMPSKEGEERLAAADQYGAIYEVSIKGKEVAVSPLEIPLKGVHGLLWFKDSLYVVVGEVVEGRTRGIFRVRDLDGDGALEDVQEMRTFQAGGEHGIHSLVPSPDGEWLYAVSYTHLTLPTILLV